MNRTIDRLKLVFLAIFAVANIVIVVWQVGWVMPREKCENAHKWWDNSQRVCAQPILTSDITGRMIVDAAGRAAALKAVGRVPPPAPAPKP